MTQVTLANVRPWGAAPVDVVMSGAEILAVVPAGATRPNRSPSSVVRTDATSAFASRAVMAGSGSSPFRPTSPATTQYDARSGRPRARRTPAALPNRTPFAPSKTLSS
ncbi:hypothetical protein [Streptomyces sp. NPDC088246]|uniref:hypothetical protein n=1 Tax=Streptomyces sp. NPDC088246 TaxID=3365842 RepID=UPI0038120454